MRISFEVPVPPVAKARARVDPRSGRHYTPKRTELGEAAVRLFAKRHAPPAPHAGPVVVDLEFVLPVPASWPRAKREAALAGLLRPTCKPDRDNLEKLTLDALTRSGRFWRDDAQVVDGRSSKVYGARPCTRVSITFAPAWEPPMSRRVGSCRA